MKTYLFQTTTTMKEYNRKHYWIDGDIVRDMKIDAENIHSALEIYKKRVMDESYIEISENAIKNKSAMYCDYKDGTTKQVGYVITGKTEIQTDDYRKPWSIQYVDLWIAVSEVAFCDFEETA